ncbi:hypothetical protein ACWCV9_17285 [Streptomyces sp. NPDC001606]
MSTYNYGNVGGPGQFGIDPRRGTVDLATLMAVAERLTEALHAEYPGLVDRGETIESELALSAEDGLPPNRGRIRTALEDVAIAASAGSASLTFTRHLTQALDL